MSLLFCICSILLVCFALQYRSRCSPAKWFLVVWGVQILFAACMSKYMIIEFSGLFFILIGCIFVFTGALSGDVYNQYFRHRNRISNKRLLTKRAIRILYVLICLAFINPLNTLYNNGFDIYVFMSMDDLLETNNSIAIARYSKELRTSFLTQILLVFTYTAPLYGGYLYNQVDKHARKICILTVVPTVFTALTQAVKMSLITAVFLWLAGFIVYSYKADLRFRINKKVLFRILIIAAGFFGILFLSMMLRTGTMSESMAEQIGRKFVTYAIGHLSAFGQWFEDSTVVSYGLGSYLFAGITNYLGIFHREQGLFLEFYRIWQSSEENTNIFTIFRVLIEDFGYIGTMVALYLFGFFSQFFRTMISRNILADFSQVMLMALWAFVMWSFVTSFFAYTSYIVMFFLIYVLLKIIYRAPNRYVH